ncbi:MAG: 6-carboxytetrahydropterin synthase QueD [Bacillota bacterium]
MYILKTKHSFDSAHFLSGYKGKCANIHGHRWEVEIEVQSMDLVNGGQCDGMIVDFSDLKGDLREVVDHLDHALIVQEGTMRKETLEHLLFDGFKVISLPFRPTAENLAYYFFQRILERGYDVKKVTVYETPTNAAVYER